MTKHIEKICPKCGQRLRFPKNVGGLLMACPSCGETFHSDFKLGGTRRPAARKNPLITLFELPGRTLGGIRRFLFPR